MTSPDLVSQPPAPRLPKNEGTSPQAIMLTSGKRTHSMAKNKLENAIKLKWTTAVRKYNIFQSNAKSSGKNSRVSL